MIYIIFIFQIVAAIMIASDASKRGMISSFWFIFVLILPILSILLYLIVRNPVLEKDLKEKGALTEEEFNIQKQKIINA